MELTECAIHGIMYEKQCLNCVEEDFEDLLPEDEDEDEDEDELDDEPTGQ